MGGEVTWFGLVAVPLSMGQNSMRRRPTAAHSIPSPNMMGVAARPSDWMNKAAPVMAFAFKMSVSVAVDAPGNPNHASDAPVAGNAALAHPRPGAPLLPHPRHEPT